MEFKKEKLVRFHSDGKQHKESLWGQQEPVWLEVSSSAYKVSSSSLLKSDGRLLGGKNSFAETFRIGRSKVFTEDHEPWRKRILDPGSEIVLQWNRVFIFSCLVALFVDPLLVLLQYVPRLYLIFPLSSQIIKATGVVTKTAWAGAAYNLLLYMLASHVLGAAWYLLSVDRYTSCWKTFCRKEVGSPTCNLYYLDC